MRFSEVARWLVGKTITKVDWAEAPTKNGARMAVDIITFTDGSSVELGGHGLLATIDYVTRDGEETEPWPDPDPELDPLGTPAIREIVDMPLNENGGKNTA